MTNPSTNSDEVDVNAIPVSEKPKRMSWLLYIGIACIIAIWTIWGALFFLAVVWIMRLNPKPYSTNIPAPSDLDRDSVKGTYTWLLISPVLTMPTMIIASEIISDYSFNDYMLAALIPLIFHTPLLFRLNTKSVFVYRHAQLAIFLIALRAGAAAFAFSTESLGLFVLVNGSLWLFGTNWARNQALRKECWLMQRKGERIILPENAEPEKHAPLITDKELANMLESLNADNIKSAKEKTLRAFQTGTPTIKKRATLVLAKLGEVEKF